MEQIIIKKEMTQDVWITDNGVVRTSKDDFIISDCQCPNTNLRANAAAICSAVNNTYGQNYNPEKVGEMYNQLMQLQFDLMAMGKSETTPNHIKDYINIRIPILNGLINSAKFIP